MFGWPCDEKIEKFRDMFAKESDPAKQKQIVIDLQKYWVDNRPTSISVSGFSPRPAPTSLDGMMVAPVPVFWNMTKK